MGILWAQVLVTIRFALGIFAPELVVRNSVTDSQNLRASLGQGLFQALIDIIGRT